MCLMPYLDDVFVDQKYKANLSYSLRIDNSYCLISLNKETICCSFFLYIKRRKDHYCQINFSAKSCNQLSNLICRHSTIRCSISFCHTLYIGKEIYKAELAKTFKQIYQQS